MYTGQEKLLYVNKSIEAFQPRYFIIYINSEETSDDFIKVMLPLGVFDRASIVNALVRSKFTQDQVEAIVNNRLLDMCEYFDILKKEGNVKANSFLKSLKEDKNYQNLQAWRSTCKQWADDILNTYK